jgi:CheY-like chemotaxis protein
MQTYRVLIVDDQRDVRRVLRSALETLGYDIKVTDVPSGEEAILVISRQPIDLLISDVRLPGITGLELKERAEVRNPNLRFILITGMLDGKTRQAVANAGADAYFFKPVEMTPFLNAVEACLGLNIEEVEEEVHPEPPPLATQKISISQPPAPPVSMPVGELPASGGVAERLASLRQELNATCVVLANDPAQVIAQAGVFPEGMDALLLLNVLMSAINSAEKVSSLLGASQAQDWLYFAGQNYDIFASPVRQATGLVVVTPHALMQNQRAEGLISAMHTATQDLRNNPAFLGMVAVKPQAAPPDPPAHAAEEEPISEDLLSSLDAIFGAAKSNNIKAEDADAFWESAVKNDAKNVPSSDALSYEQARQLGLAPDGN